ncbi:unnamed protein product [Microthlaspi erraticum]|uniref:RBR-type E3 ubiquitin transferase n=1 Tax=Microthlaspi erraticum TaxID=1685480 RepID=A0A6D2KAD2_9BRAS|nr:unnamed protein product [Microthlaspi erraticum]
MNARRRWRFQFLDRVYCPKSSCSFLMSDRDQVMSDKSEARKSLECGLNFCRKCHVLWHYKKICEEFKKSELYRKSGDALLESLVKKEAWKKCPLCATVVQQNGGCKRITCRF